MEATIPDRRAALGLILFAAALRLATLPLRRLIEGDGVHYAQLARAVLAGDLSGLANPYWSNLWPALIAATSLVTGLGVVAAGRLAAGLSGVLLVFATATLATRLFGPTPGLVAGMLCAVHPWLIHFSTLVFTEPLFSLLVVSVLVVAARVPAGWRTAGAAGGLAGLAVITRPEAYAVVAAVLGWLVLAGPRTRGRLARAVLFVAIVALFVGGRALLVHHYYGQWDFGVGTKGTANLFVGLARDDSEMERVATEVGPDGRNTLSQRSADVTLLGFGLAHPALLATHVARNLVRLGACVFRVFPFVPLVGGRPAPWAGGWPALAIAVALASSGFALLGLAWACRESASRPMTLLLLATGALYLLGLAPLFVHDRLVVALVPLFLVFVAYGLVGSARLFVGTERRVRGILIAALAIVGVLSVARLHQARALDYAADPPVQREAGEWLAAHYPPDTRIMTAAVSVGFYFYDAPHMRNELRLPWGDLDRVLALARQQGATLLVVPEWHLRAVRHPAAAALEPESAPPGLHHVVTLGEPTAGRIFIYEIPPIGDGRAAP